MPVYGISRDSVDTHERFKKENRLPFELLADTDGSVAKVYKAQVPLLGVTKRITYLINKEGRIAAAHDELFGDVAHVRKMVAALEG